MQVFVKTLVGGTLCLRFQSGSPTVEELKQAIEESEGVPRSAQQLLHKSRYLSGDSLSLTESGVESGSTITILLRLAGGMQAPVQPRARLDLNSKPPPNYVAGLGRGATGFTTRSDIGPARAAPDLSDRTAGGPGAGRGRGKGPGGGAEDDEDDAEDKGYDENQKFDEFEGNDVGLFATGEYDEDDREADAIWESIDRKMDSRRKARREARLKQEIESFRASNPKITEQLADVKRKLQDLTPDEWMNIPEVGDHSLRNKKRRFESFTPVPDTLLEKARQEKEHVTALDPRSRGAAVVAGSETPYSQTDLTAVGEGRGTVLSLKLDRLSDSVSGLTVTDPKGYLTHLKSMKFTSDAEISDIKKARLLLKSVIQTNPKHAPGWIAAARLEEVAGKLQAARTFIREGCEECPRNEDVWMEACRLATPENAKKVLAQAVKVIPASVKLWLHAAVLEHDDAAKSRVLMKGLEFIPDSIRLWKALVELASEDDARVLLARATECCKQHVEFWLALARLETYENARVVLNKARSQLPKEPAIWIAAAKLEEAQGNADRVEKLIERAIGSLKKHIEIDREYWMKEAEAAERASSVLTCQAIIKHTIGVGVEEEDKKRTWVADADECKKRLSIETARAIYKQALEAFPGKKGIWLKAAQLEKSHGTRESLDKVLADSVRSCPQSEVLWLMGAKEKWLAGDVAGAREILMEAYKAIQDSEEIWLAAFKLEFENREPERAKLLLAKARAKRSCSARVWMKSAIVERELGNAAEEKKLLEEGLKKFPDFPKLWLMLGQLHERLGDAAAAKSAYSRGIEKCPDSIPLWLSSAQLEERVAGISRARAILTTARVRNKEQPELWLAAIRAETRAGNWDAAEALLAKALQECQRSGILLAADIEMVPRAQRKMKSTQAILNTKNSPYVFAVVGKFFWQDRKVDKARSWFTRAATLAPDVGDFWALLYKFEVEHGSEAQQLQVVEQCKTSEPKHGEHWIRVSKAVENAHQPVEFVLQKVAASMGKDQGLIITSSRQPPGAPPA